MTEEDKNKSSNDNQWVAWNKGEKWIDFSVFNIVIFDFDKIDLIL